MRARRLTAALGLDEDARGSRLRLLEVGGKDRVLLRELAGVLSPHLEELLREWHAFLLERPETRDLLARGRAEEHLQKVQSRYFRVLFEGPYDGDYFEDRLHIGFVHERVGLEPVSYMAAYRKFLALVREFLFGQGHEIRRVNRWLDALEKVVYLDMQLALDAYFHTKNSEILKTNQNLRELADQLEIRNREITRQFEKAKEAARVKEEFLSKVSHELCTPLNAVIGFADLLVDGIEGPLNAEQAHSLHKIRDHGARLLEMIDQMIDAAKMAAAGLAEPCPFDPNPLLEELRQTAGKTMASKGLSFHSGIPPDLPVVRGDEEGFQLALGHLLENAGKFTVSGSVRLDAARSGNVVRCTVSDTGPGIPEAHRKRVFEPFHQVESGDTRSTTGLGMGLTLARQALERMGGVLELVSTGSSGTVFALELPVHADVPSHGDGDGR